MSKKIIVMISIGLLLITGSLFGIEKTTSAAGKLPKQVISLNQEKVSIAQQANPNNEGLEFSSLEDIASIAIGRIKAYEILENDSTMNDRLNGAQPGDPLKVKSLDDKGDYYIVPLIKNDKYVGSIRIRIIDGKARLGSIASFTPVDEILPVSADEAISILKNTKGFTEVPEPILVFKISKLSMDRKLPFWEFTFSDGTKYYVNQDSSVFDKIEEFPPIVGD